MSKNIVKIGTVELYENEVEKLYYERKYIVTYTGVYQIHYSNASKQFYSSKILQTKGLAKRGRFYTMTAETINHILGQKILVEN